MVSASGRVWKQLEHLWEHHHRECRPWFFADVNHFDRVSSPHTARPPLTGTVQLSTGRIIMICTRNNAQVLQTYADDGAGLSRTVCVGRRRVGALTRDV